MKWIFRSLVKDNGDKFQKRLKNYDDIAFLSQVLLYHFLFSQNLLYFTCYFLIDVTL